MPGNINVGVVSATQILENGVGMFGAGQTPQDVTATRAYGTLYTNSSGRTIAVNICGMMALAQTRFYIEIDGVKKWEATPAPVANSLSYSFFVVPHGSTYKVVGTQWSSLYFWSEFR